MVLVIYLISLVLGLLVALPFYGAVRAETDHSLAFDALLDGFDYTVFTDFMQEKGNAISPLLSVGRWASVVYLLLSVFFTGGILMRFAEPHRPVILGAFWQACSHYFRRYVGLFALSTGVVLLLAFVWLIVCTLFILAFADALSERELFGIGLSCFLAFALMVTLVLCIGDYAKVDMLRRDERNALRAFRRASALVFRHLVWTYGLYWVLLLMGAGLFALYFTIESAVGMSNWTTILLMLLIQQVFIAGRIGLKVATLGVSWQVYDQRMPLPAVYAGPSTIETPSHTTDETRTNEPLTNEPARPASNLDTTKKTTE
ncbi:hypothetical protein GCM10023187_37730 [Nibrella viscosa]|uniref:Uncharacterized protein n=2 Tax=Nibrella viscosa TaxID=1084524 RepID=A0ABP8KQ73_9BACT